MAEDLSYDQFADGTGVNYFAVDRTLQRELLRVYPEEAYEWAMPRLTEFGELVGHEIAPNADIIDDNGPELSTYDRHGDRCNRVDYHPLQIENERRVYESGIVADCFHPPPGRDDPLPFTHNLAMQYLLSYADPGFDCPVAMTTGVALVLERFDDGSLETYFDGLTSRTYADVIEGAMFLTEKQGGSDVGAIETSATYDEATENWQITGEKWFCSNIDAQGTLVLARTPDAPEGTDGLSMFLVPHRLPDGTLNDQLYRRLKDKLGTISVPTGEVELTGATGFLVGEQMKGFKQMTEMLNLERLSNAAASCGIIGRALLEAKIHAASRRAFGERLDDLPLMRVDLVDMAIAHEAATAFTFEAARIFAAREQARRAGESADAQYRLMRILVPIAKARTARMAVDTASYAMEILGGNGYVNDFVTHRLLRDAQVLPIWEGTENILSLDVLRAMQTEQAHNALFDLIDGWLADVDHPQLTDDLSRIETARINLEAPINQLAADPVAAQRSAKQLLHELFDVTTAALLLHQGNDGIRREQNARTALVARRFIHQHLGPRQIDGDPFVSAHFDAIVRYADADPNVL